jgi:hypothetical protein
MRTKRKGVAKMGESDKVDRAVSLFLGLPLETQEAFIDLITMMLDAMPEHSDT